MKILVAGGPRTGKTTLANKLAEEHNILATHCDDLIGQFGWSEASFVVATWMARPAPWVIEGVQVFRALRKWLARHERDDIRPADILYINFEPLVPLIRGQEAMLKGCRTVWKEIQSEIERREVSIRYW